MIRLVLAAVLATALGSGVTAAPPEPEGFRGEPYRAPVPATLEGARVIDAAEAERFWREGTAIFVDALPRTPRPENLPEGTLWQEPPHVTIEGAIWLPNTGYERLSPDEETYLAEGLEEATEGDRNRPIVVFCKRDCWMSWNTAKRALILGYTDVRWFPEGLDGWQERGLPVAVAQPF